MGVMSRLDAPRVAVVGAALADGMSATLQHDTTLLVCAWDPIRRGTLAPGDRVDVRLPERGARVLARG